MFYPEHYTGEIYKGHGKSFAYQFWGSTKSNYEIIDEILSHSAITILLRIFVPCIK